MKSFRIFIILCAILSVAACSEETDLRSSGEHQEFISVEAIITDRADRPQQVLLSKSVPYFEEASSQGLSGAIVTISDGNEEVRFSEKETGVYEAPAGYHGEPGGN